MALFCCPTSSLNEPFSRKEKGFGEECVCRSTSRNEGVTGFRRMPLILSLLNEFRQAAL